MCIRDRSADADDLPDSFPRSFTQWSADNVDHNVHSLDGSGSFHGMGIISMSTAYCRVPCGTFSLSPVPRCDRVKVADVVKNKGNKGNEIENYVVPQQSALSQLPLKPIDELVFGTSTCKTAALDMMWHLGRMFTDAQRPRPNRSGFMLDTSVPLSSYPPVSDIRMLPLT